MASWDEREKYLIKIAKKCLVGHKSFDLCRSHLVSASQISKGTIYNHFVSEFDLMVAIAEDFYNDFLEQALLDDDKYLSPMDRFIFHHCKRLYDSLRYKRFTIERVMPNSDICEQASLRLQMKFEETYATYQKWNEETIQLIGEVPGFDRKELVKNFIRGTMIDSGDSEKDFNDVSIYQKFSFAIINLSGHSDHRTPTKTIFEDWLHMVNSLDATDYIGLNIEHKCAS
ncbi:TetR/AcrR family transcriptional regulator [Shewanella mangrovi]|uniref:TetR/AcrR family transcriptional regulator n=1 Tax=Shewanella mangrovi TaxID=1515746 RepID=UPI00068DDE6D|nr:TetR/AcrR family transcriptional regulator [Shewanella mangrovi]